MKIYTTEQQLPFLLPSMNDLDAMERHGEWVNQFGEDVYPRFVASVRRNVKAIIKSPGDPELWMEMANHFGAIDELFWKFIYVAHRLDPYSRVYLEAMNRVVWRLFASSSILLVS